MTDSATETRCPACQTVFAVEAEDLERAGGRVRCGDCMQVFDARAHALRDPAGAPAGEPPEASTPGEETRDGEAPASNADAAAPADARDSAGTSVLGIDDDHAEEIDDTPFTATNWFIVDEAGELAPMEGATNDETAPEDATTPEVEDSGAFRFGDDTPPDTLRAELAALVGDEVDDIEGIDTVPAGDRAPAEAELEPDANAPQAGAAPDDPDTQDDDWDDLLGELDEQVEARLDIAREVAEPGQEPEPETQPEPAETAAASVVVEDVPVVEAVQHVAAAAADPEPAPLDFELVETDVPGRETSVDLDLTRATVETGTPDFQFLDDDLPAADIAPVDPGQSGAADAPPAADPGAGLEAEQEPAEAGPDAATEDAAEPGAAPAGAARDADDFDAAALDDMMDALRELDKEPESLAGDGAAAEPAADGGDAAAPAEARDDAPGADDAAADGETHEQAPGDAEAQQATAADDEDRAVGEDTINAMVEGERGEVIVLGSEAEAEAESASDAGADEDHDTTFAESMIVSPELAPKPRRTGLWLTLSVLAALGLALQAVHGWRGRLATMPFWQDALPRIYGTIGVPLTPEWDIRRWCVETSGALASEAGLDIEAIFSNRGDTALPPPVLKVRIVDPYSNTLAATLISPADYLADGGAATRVAPGARITALARLDYNEPRLDGYEVSLCYANADGTLRCGAGCNDGD